MLKSLSARRLTRRNKQLEEGSEAGCEMCRLLTGGRGSSDGLNSGVCGPFLGWFLSFAPGPSLAGVGMAAGTQWMEAPCVSVSLCHSDK